MKTVYGYWVWFIATLFVIYAFCLNTAAAVFSSSIKTALHSSDVQFSYAAGAFICGFALMQIPAGYLLDRYNTRIVVSAGVLLLGLGNLLISFAPNIVLFSIANFIQGIGGSFAFIAAAVLISNWFDQKLFPILFGLTQTLSCVLSGIIHYLFMVALQTHPWNELYHYLFGFGLILFVLTLIFVYSPKKEREAPSLSLGTALKLVSGNKQVWFCSIAAATTFGVLLAYGGFWYLNVQNFYSVSSEQSLIISGIIFVGVGIGTPLFGYLSNRFRSRIMVTHLTIVLGNMFLILGLYLPHYSFDSLIIIKVVSFFIGFFLSGSMLFYTIVSEISTDQIRGVALSVVNTLVFLFNTFLLFIPYLFITSISKTFFTYLWILPFSVMISMLLIYFIKETYPSSPTEPTEMEQ